MNKTYRYLLTAAITLGLIVMPLFQSTTQYSIFADGGPDDECENAQATSVTTGTEDSRSYNAGSGNIVTGVCIKSGAGMFGDTHSGALGNGNYENGCYTVSGVGTQTVTVTKNFGGSSCKGISHLDVYFQGQSPTNTPTNTPTNSPTNTPTNTPTNSPTNSPTPTPTDTDGNPTITPTPTCAGTCIIVDCPGGGECEVTIGNSPTPTASPTATPTDEQGPTATPTPTSGDSDSDPTPTNTPGSGGTGGQSNTTEGDILGTTTLAKTGTAASTLMQFALAAGILMVSVSTLSYAREKKS